MCQSTFQSNGNHCHSLIGMKVFTGTLKFQFNITTISQTVSWAYPSARLFPGAPSLIESPKARQIQQGLPVAPFSAALSLIYLTQQTQAGSGKTRSKVWLSSAEGCWGHSEELLNSQGAPLGSVELCKKCCISFTRNLSGQDSIVIL